MRGKIISATFDGWETARTSPIFQYDYGQLLVLTDLELPASYEVHFSTDENGGASYTVLGDENGVAVPDVLIAEGKYIFAFVFLHEGTDDGETEYKITIPVKKRPEIAYVEPPAEQVDIISQTIAAMNDAADRAAGSATAAAGSATEAAASATAAEGSASDAAASATQSAGSAEQAGTYAGNAASSAAQAGTYAGNAESSAAQSAQSAADAEHYADLAGQGAASAGYMEIQIDESGHLIYTRTDAVDVDFSLDDSGHLIMEAV